MKKIAVYGTLRPPDYNFKRFGDSLEKVGNGIIRGFKMYNLGSYPCVIRTGDNNDIVVVDILLVKDRETALYIDGMESGAGYKSVMCEVLENPKSNKIVGSFPTYIYDGQRLRAPSLSYTYIKTGDWILHKFGDKKDIKTVEPHLPEHNSEWSSEPQFLTDDELRDLDEEEASTVRAENVFGQDRIARAITGLDTGDRDDEGQTPGEAAVSQANRGLFEVLFAGTRAQSHDRDNE